MSKAPESLNSEDAQSLHGTAYHEAGHFVVAENYKLHPFVLVKWQGPSGHYRAQRAPPGGLCVIDREPRQLSREQLESLRLLSRQVIAQVTLGKNLQELKIALQERDKLESDQVKLIQDLQQAKAKIQTLEGIIPMCAWCKKVRDDKGYWEQVEDYIYKFAGVFTTSSICPDCLQKNFEDLGRLPKP